MPPRGPASASGTNSGTYLAPLRDNRYITKQLQRAVAGRAHLAAVLVAEGIWDK
jgi:hypothetical protein